MASLIEAIERLSARCSSSSRARPTTASTSTYRSRTARGGQTLVRLKDAQSADPGGVRQDVQGRWASLGAGPRHGLTPRSSDPGAYGYHFMDQETFETVTLGAAMVGDDRLLLVDNVLVQIQKIRATRLAWDPSRPHVELTVTSSEPGAPAGTRPAAASPRLRRSKPASRFGCRSSSRTGRRRSKSTPRRVSLRGGRKSATFTVQKLFTAEPAEHAESFGKTNFDLILLALPQ